MLDFSGKQKLDDKLERQPYSVKRQAIQGHPRVRYFPRNMGIHAGQELYTEITCSFSCAYEAQI